MASAQQGTAKKGETWVLEAASKECTSKFSSYMDISTGVALKRTVRSCERGSGPGQQSKPLDLSRLVGEATARLLVATAMGRLDSRRSFAVSTC
eukprot:6475272-Amphidinium_carterae.2